MNLSRSNDELNLPGYTNIHCIRLKVTVLYLLVNINCFFNNELDATLK